MMSGPFDCTLVDYALRFSEDGLSWYSSGHFDHALNCFKESAVLISDTIGEDSPQLAATYHNIGNTLLHLGDFPRALAAFEECLRIEECRVHGAANPISVATSLLNIGRTYVRMNNNACALEHYEKSLAALQGQPASETTAIVLNNLGTLCYTTGNYDRAVKCFEESMTIWTQEKGNTHPRTIATLHNLAAACRKNGDTVRYRVYLTEIIVAETGASRERVDTLVGAILEAEPQVPVHTTGLSTSTRIILVSGAILCLGLLWLRSRRN